MASTAQWARLLRVPPCVLAVSLLTIFAGPSIGQTLVFDDGLMHVFDTFAEFVEVRGPGTQLSVESGAFAFGLLAEDTAHVQMSDGYLQHVNLTDSTRLELFGGWIEGDFGVGADASLLVAGGLTGWTDQVDVLGQLEVTGGTFSNELTIGGSGVAYITGGTFTDRLKASGTSLTFVNGEAVVPFLSCWNQSQVWVQDGDFGLAWLNHNAALSISGGIVDSLRADDSSTISVHGTEFAVDGVSVPEGPLTAMAGTLTGTLQNGDPLDSAFEQGGGLHTGTIVVTSVPEPSTPALLGPGLAALVCASRRRRRRGARQLQAGPG